MKGSKKFTNSCFVRPRSIKATLSSFLLLIFFTLPGKGFSQSDSSTILNVPGYPYMFELDPGETKLVALELNGKKITRNIKLISVKAFLEPNYWFRNNPETYSKAEVEVEVSGKKTTLLHRPYQMPVEFNGLRIYVETIQEWARNAEFSDMKNVGKTVRLSVCAAGQSWGPSNMIFPIKDYRWKSAAYQNTWSALVPYNLRYYHRGEDYGAIPDKLDVVAPFDGTIITSPLPEGDGRSNAVFIKNKDGMVFRLSHMNIESILPGSAAGNNIQTGSAIGKTGMTWNGKRTQNSDPHLHCDLRYNTTLLASYPYLMEAYLRTFPDKVIAVAGGYHFTTSGRTTELDGSRSIAAKGQKIRSYKWTLHDGRIINDARFSLTYSKPGLYTEELMVTTESGMVDRDFVQVRVYDSTTVKDLAYGWTYFFPLRGIQPNSQVLFWNRLVNTKTPVTIDYGDGSSETIDKESHHSYKTKGRYVVTLSSKGIRQEPITVKMEVVVE
jgi:murein DD-endopeptidase MepM/ murein hydrolase activator NlpD